jgi:hypothetical protein
MGLVSMMCTQSRCAIWPTWGLFWAPAWRPPSVDTGPRVTGMASSPLPSQGQGLGGPLSKPPCGCGTTWNRPLPYPLLSEIFFQGTVVTGHSPWLISDHSRERSRTYYLSWSPSSTVDLCPCCNAGRSRAWRGEGLGDLAALWPLPAPSGLPVGPWVGTLPGLVQFL